MKLRGSKSNSAMSISQNFINRINKGFQEHFVQYYTHNIQTIQINKGVSITVHVVDSVMGSGKSSAAIQYINDHPDKRYLVVVLFNEETERFAEECKNVEFAIPDRRFNKEDSTFNKSNHLRLLVEEGLNIVLTHSLFSYMSEETCDLIADQAYTIFIDEAMDVIDQIEIAEDDMRMYINSGAVTKDEDSEDDSIVFYSNSPNFSYNGKRFEDVHRFVKTNRLVVAKNKSNNKSEMYYITMYKRMFELSEDIYILTYLFEGCLLRAFFDLHHIPYDYYGVQKTADGKYYFSTEATQPEYLSNISSLINVVQNEKRNAIGDLPGSLSKRWWNTHIKSPKTKKIEELKGNVDYFFDHTCRGIKIKDKLWTTFKGCEKYVVDDGYKRRDIPFNSRAVNKYSNCKAVAYLVNVFLKPDIMAYFSRGGIKIDQDLYALSSMLQFIWRSAIRNGEPITVYVPSSRMRNLLLGWMSRVEQGLPR